MSKRQIFTTEPHGDQSLCRCDNPEEKIGNRLFELSSKGSGSAIVMTGEELTSLAKQWLAHCKDSRYIIGADAGLAGAEMTRKALFRGGKIESIETKPANVLPRHSSAGSERDWPEDFIKGTNRYECYCCVCRRSFFADKRRVVCRLCSSPGSPPPYELACRMLNAIGWDGTDFRLRDPVALAIAPEVERINRKANAEI